MLKPCDVQLIKNLKSFQGDAICIISKKVPEEFSDYFEELRMIDASFDSEVSLFINPKTSHRIIYSPVGILTDYHDVRILQKSIAKGISRAIKAGSQHPLIILDNLHEFPNAELCSVLGALHELYVPIQYREDVPEKQQRVKTLSIYLNTSSAEDIFQDALLLESGRFVARDIGAGDPERMTPLNVERYLKNYFQLNIKSINQFEELKIGYPLFAAVNRAANTVPKHNGRIIILEYIPPKESRKTLMLVGKGVTYDTGGADIKFDGMMAGMSRDKCGAAAVAGFMQIVQKMAPQHIHVIAALCMVRNSVGEECYVSDEIITSRAGVRVRVGNTDAEGRMCMADALCQMKELALNLPDPHIFTIATLTGHACLTVGQGYSIAIDNSVAKKYKHAEKLKAVGENYGEPFEISTLRQDDFDFNKGQVIGEDLVQCNNLASSKTQRGHQIPAAFMIVASGLDKHGLTSQKPLKYTHIDIAGSSGAYPKMPTGIPIVTLVKAHLMEDQN